MAAHSGECPCVLWSTESHMHPRAFSHRLVPVNAACVQILAKITKARVEESIIQSAVTHATMHYRPLRCRCKGFPEKETENNLMDSHQNPVDVFTGKTIRVPAGTLIRKTKMVNMATNGIVDKWITCEQYDLIMGGDAEEKRKKKGKKRKRTTEGARSTFIECCVCKNEAATYALVPCGHQCLCGACVPQVRTRRCPLCRARFVRALRIFA